MAVESTTNDHLAKFQILFQSLGQSKEVVSQLSFELSAWT
jgi:hypothetical protein